MREDTWGRFQLGYSLPDWEALARHLQGKGYQEADVLSAGLTVEREGGGHYDRFRGRLVFPIHDGRGRVVGFGGRALDDSMPKYVNTPQTPSSTRAVSSMACIWPKKLSAPRAWPSSSRGTWTY